MTKTRLKSVLLAVMLVSSVFAGVALADDTSEETSEQNVDKDKIHTESLGVDEEDNNLGKYRITNEHDHAVTLNWTVLLEETWTNRTGTVTVEANSSETVLIEDVTAMNVIAFECGDRVVARQATNTENKDFGEPNDDGDDAEEIEASLTFDAQKSDGESVTVKDVTLKEDGFVVVTDENGTVIGTSEHLEAGSYDCIEIQLDKKLCEDQKLKATIYCDTNDDQKADWSDGDSDSDGHDGSGGDEPYEQGGDVVCDSAYIEIC